MKVATYRNDEERTVLTGLITSDELVSRLFKTLSSAPNCFASKWTRLVSGWVVEFYRQYGKAPKGAIQGMFASWAESHDDEETVDMVESFLVRLSEDQTDTSANLEFMVDMATSLFKRNAMRHLAQALEGDLLDNRMDDAETRLSGFMELSFKDSSTTVDVLTDQAALTRAFEEDLDAVVRYPGDLGTFFGAHLCRDGLVSFLAPEKRGKSFWLIDLAWRAVLQKRNTYIYSVGDMSEAQMYRRIAMRAARRPLRAGTYYWPKAMRRDGTEVVIRNQKKVANEPLVATAVSDVFEKVIRKAGSASRLKMKTTANSTTSVADISSDLRDAVRQGWIPDVVVIDYADILAPEPGASSKEPRHQIDATWRALRRLSQEFHILVATATQSDAPGARVELLSVDNFSEDKRKAAHVTGMIGINQNTREKERGIFRLNWIHLREGKFSQDRVVRVAGNLGISCPAICSCF